MIFIYVTCKDKSEALSIGRKLLEKKLAACVNIIPKIISLTLWPPKTGKIEEAEESVLICKTLDSKYVEVEKEILELHSYENPFIGSIPITEVQKKYSEWMMGELKK